MSALAKKIVGACGLVLLLAGCRSFEPHPVFPCRFEFPFMNDYDVVNSTTFGWNDAYVTNNPTEYHQEIAGPLCALAGSVYGYRLFTDVRSFMDMGFPPERLKRCYGKDLSYAHPKYGRDRVGYTIASRMSETAGADYEIVIVAIRGTFGRDEWLSNVNIANEWGERKRLDPATLPLCHEGFSKAADSVMDALAEYVASNRVDLSKAKILVTGHSRGAAVANLVGYRLDRAEGGEAFAAVKPENLFVYTFATPNVTIRETDAVNDPKCSNIFNILNPEDIVPNVPMPFWGSKRFGRDLYLKSFDHLPFTGSWTHPGYCEMKNQFKAICGYEYYHVLLGTNVNDLVQSMAQTIAPTVRMFYWIHPEMRKEGNLTSTHSFVEMALWHRMASAEDQARNVSLMSDFNRLSNAYSDLTNAKGREAAEATHLDHKLRFLLPNDDLDAPFDPDGRNFDRQPDFTDLGWSLSATHSYLTYISWMKSGAINGPEWIYVNWEE